MPPAEPLPRNELRLAIELLIKLSVDHPEDVFVEVTDKPGGVLVTVHCSPDEGGKLIGRQGRLARAWRTLLLGIRRKYGCVIDLDFASTTRDR